MAMSISERRIKREIQELLQNMDVEDFPICLDLVEGNYNHFNIEIAGPPETPYEGGTFKVEINIPSSYPFSPPKVRFMTRIWHPNISSLTGAVCLDILKDQWAASMNLRTVLLSLLALLAAAEPDDPQDAVVARQYKQKPDIFKKTAAYWTCVYAGGPDCTADFEQKILQIMDMGFGVEQARVALSTHDWNTMQATDALLS